MARLRVLTGNLPDGRVAVPFAVLRRLGLAAGGTVRLQAGLCATTAALEAGAPPGRIVLSAAAAEELTLPPGLRVSVWRTADGRLRLGPLVGLFTVRRGRRRFGPQTPFVRAVARRGRRAGVVAYIFTPDEVCWESLTVLGCFRQGRRWLQARLPLPDVVYDRVSTRTDEELAPVAEARRRLQELLPGRYFNPGFLDKQAVHEMLSRDPVLAAHLPATESFTPEVLERMLRRYRRVYLKPVGGSLGRGIVRVTRTGRRRYVFRRSGGGRGTARGPERLTARLGGLLGRRPYLVQQAVPLATYGGRPFDVRVLIQKNGSGRWVITRTYARVAGAGRIVSNVCRGGRGQGLGRVLRWTVRGRPQRTIRRVSRRVARVLEAEMGCPLGELGVDLAVTRGGKVFVLEVNSKPYRMTWGWGSGPTFRYPLAYARYLAKKPDGSKSGGSR